MTTENTQIMAQRNLKEGKNKFPFLISGQWMLMFKIRVDSSNAVETTKISKGRQLT
jgi:hypothetical protein